MADSIDAVEFRPTLPETRPSLPQNMPDILGGTRFKQPIRSCSHFLLCVSGLLVGLNDMHRFVLAKPASLESSLVFYACTSLPFAFGAICAVVFLDPLVTSFHRRPCSLLAAASLLIGCLHALALIRPLLCGSQQQHGTFAVVLHLTLGFGNTLIVTMSAVALFVCGGRTVVLLGALYGTVALGIVLLTWLTGINTHIRRNGGFAVVDAKGQHLVVLALGLVTSAGCRILDTIPVQFQRDQLKNGSGTSLSEVSVPFRHGDTLEAIPETSNTTGGYSYPPLATRSVLFGAIFALNYHAITVIISAVFVSSITQSSRDGTAGYRAATNHVMAAFWLGIAMGRFMLVIWSDRVRHKQGAAPRIAALAVVAVMGAIQLPLMLTPRNLTAAAGLVGLMVGPVYPWGMDMVLRQMNRIETPGGMGITVAFGYSGETISLLTTQLVAHSSQGPMILYAIIIGLIACVLVCWAALTGARNEGTGAPHGIVV